MKVYLSSIVATHRKRAALLAGALLSCAAALSPLPQAALAGPQVNDADEEEIVRIIPNFASIKYGWLAIDDELKPMMSGPRPVRADPDFPYFGNQNGTQPTLRVSDLNSPILTEWSKKLMRPSN